MLNFWATWCAPCVFEMPELEAAYEAYRENGLMILAINRAEEQDRVNDFLQNELDVAVTFPILLDEEVTVANRYQIVNMPTTYFIDGAGTITAVHRGPLTREQIDDYLSGTLQDG
jgi:thiol-disulfide isomerase/thioredoxin